MCQHVAHSLATDQPVGFFWSADSDADRPDTWCRDCNDRVRETNGEWTGEAAANLGVTLVCGSCYDRARALNGF